MSQTWKDGYYKCLEHKGGKLSYTIEVRGNKGDFGNSSFTVGTFDNEDKTGLLPGETCYTIEGDFAEFGITGHANISGDGETWRWMNGAVFEWTAESRPESVPGEIHFKPTKEWLTEKLGVPVEQCEIVEEHMPKSLGQSGAKYVKVKVKYGGSHLHPSLGLPENLFVKLRVDDNEREFLTEAAVAGLCKYLPQKLPMARTLWAGPFSTIAEDLSKKVNNTDCIEGRFTGDAMKRVLDAYATVHACFWGLHKNDHLANEDAWSAVFTGAFAPHRQDQCLDGFEVPQAANIKKVRDDIGLGKLLKHLNRGPVTLCQGDAHAGQVLMLDNGDVKLIDWSWGLRAHPAIDIGGIMTSLKPEYRIEHGRELVSYYWEKLTEKLGTVSPEMTFNEFWEGYKLGCLLRGLFIAALTGADAPDMKPFYHAHFRFFDDEWLASLTHLLSSPYPAQNP